MWGMSLIDKPACQVCGIRSLCVESNCHSVPKCCGGKDDLKK